MRHSSLIAAFGIPHNPHVPTWVASGRLLAEEIEAYDRPVREVSEGARHIHAELMHDGFDVAHADERRRC